MTIKPGMIFQPTDKRRTDRRIKVERTTITRKKAYALCTSRRIGERKWKPAPSAILVSRLLGRHYKLVKGV